MVVKADKKSLADTRRAPTACGSKPDQDSRVFVIVGGGKCIGCTVVGKVWSKRVVALCRASFC